MLQRLDSVGDLGQDRQIRQPGERRPERPGDGDRGANLEECLGFEEALQARLVGGLADVISVARAEVGPAPEQVPAFGGRALAPIDLLAERSGLESAG